MGRSSTIGSRSRRSFLAASGGLVAAAAAGNPSAFGAVATEESRSRPLSPGAARKIPSGVFDPTFPDMRLDQMIEGFAGWGVEAVEIGTGGYPSSKHCPVEELLADPAKLRAWNKKFEDRNIRVMTLSCHGNPVHPDGKIAEPDWQTFQRTVLLAERVGVSVIVGSSGCPGGRLNDTMPYWVTCCWPPVFAQMMDW